MSPLKDRTHRCEISLPERPIWEGCHWPSSCWVQKPASRYPNQTPRSDHLWEVEGWVGCDVPLLELGYFDSDFVLAFFCILYFCIIVTYLHMYTCTLGFFDMISFYLCYHEIDALVVYKMTMLAMIFWIYCKSETELASFHWKSEKHGHLDACWLVWVGVGCFTSLYMLR